VAGCDDTPDQEDLSKNTSVSKEKGNLKFELKKFELKTNNSVVNIKTSDQDEIGEIILSLCLKNSEQGFTQTVDRTKNDVFDKSSASSLSKSSDKKKLMEEFQETTKPLKERLKALGHTEPRISLSWEKNLSGQSKQRQMADVLMTKGGDLNISCNLTLGD